MFGDCTERQWTYWRKLSPSKQWWLCSRLSWGSIGFCGNRGDRIITRLRGGTVDASASHVRTPGEGLVSRRQQPPSGNLHLAWSQHEGNAAMQIYQTSNPTICWHCESDRWGRRHFAQAGWHRQSLWKVTLGKVTLAITAISLAGSSTGLSSQCSTSANHHRVGAATFSNKIGPMWAHMGPNPDQAS